MKKKVHPHGEKGERISQRINNKVMKSLYGATNEVFKAEMNVSRYQKTKKKKKSTAIKPIKKKSKK